MVAVLDGLAQIAADDAAEPGRVHLVVVAVLVVGDGLRGRHGDPDVVERLGLLVGPAGQAGAVAQAIDQREQGVAVLRIGDVARAYHVVDVVPGLAALGDLVGEEILRPARVGGGVPVWPGSGDRTGTRRRGHLHLTRRIRHPPRPAHRLHPHPSGLCHPVYHRPQPLPPQAIALPHTAAAALPERGEGECPVVTG